MSHPVTPHQPPPPEKRVAAALGVLLLRSNRTHLYGQLTEDLPGVDTTTYPVLSGLARLGPTTATRLAEAIGLDRTVTTRYATRLERAGLIGRSTAPADARAVQLELTGRGLDAVQRMRSALERMIREAMTGWTPQQSEIFAAGLEQFADVLAAGAGGAGAGGAGLRRMRDGT
jgi:DNA-binding MarR family transcriptional regulator